MPSKRPTESTVSTKSITDSPLDQSALLSLVGYNLRQAYLLNIVPVFQKQRMAKYKLRPVDYTILSLLKANANINQKRLAKAINVSPPNMATVLDRLEARNLLIRQRNPMDKRAQTLMLTPDGLLMCTKVAKTLEELELDATAALTDAERAELIRLSQKLFLPKAS